MVCLPLQINGVDMEGARHDQAVSMLTGLERYVRLVVEREVLVPRESVCSSPSPSPSPGSEKSPRVFGVPKPYTGLYSANSYMANRPAYTSYRRPTSDQQTERTSSTNYGKLPGLRNEPTQVSGTVPNSDLKASGALPGPPHTNAGEGASVKVDGAKIEPPRPAPRRVAQAQSSDTSTAERTSLPAASSEPAQVLPKPITNEDFQAMIPAKFLQQPNSTDPAHEPSGPTVTVTIKQPEHAAGDINFPPAPTSLGKVTETITKSTFTETVVTRVTENKFVPPVIIEVSLVLHLQLDVYAVRLKPSESRNRSSEIISLFKN